jgi:hypothetical protein
MERMDTMTTVDFELAENDIEYLNQYLASTCFTLLNVNKDVFWKELREPANQKTMRTFAGDKNQRALLVAKLDKAGNKGAGGGVVDGAGPGKEEELNATDKSLDLDSDMMSQYDDGDSSKVELRFSLKVVYLG